MPANRTVGDGRCGDVTLDPGRVAPTMNPAIGPSLEIAGLILAIMSWPCNYLAGNDPIAEP